MAAPQPTVTRNPGTAESGAPARGDSGTSEALPANRRSEGLWIGWRLRLLVAATLVGCIFIFGLVRFLASTLVLDATWATDARGKVVLIATADPGLAGSVGQSMKEASGTTGPPIAVDASLLQRSPRWTVEDTARARLVAMHRAVGAALAQGPVKITFEDGTQATATPRERGVAGLGLMFWPISALALLVYLVGLVVWVARPQPRNALFVLITLCQSINLLFIAVEGARGLPLPTLVVAQDLWLRIALDIITAAAIVHAFTLHPTKLPHGQWTATACWAVGLVVIAFGRSTLASGLWWWSQGTVILLGAVSVAVLTWSHRLQPNPFTVMMRRFGFVTVGSLALLTLALAAASGVPGIQHRVAEVGSGVWYVFLASMLLLVPFLARSQQLLREFALLAGISTVATSLDLLFVALFSLGQFTSITLSVFLSLGIYAGARQWILNQLVGGNVLTLERSFEKLYRVAREVEEYPERHEALMLMLLRDLFDPLEVQKITRMDSRARALADGSALLVPAPRRTEDDDKHGTTQEPKAWLLRYARRGKRLFTQEDARLADRVAEQLRRAVAYDKAVERGRSEERLRIAQDLHDDIGARLLTLMYKAQNPEMEDYVRHTLRDLKTLTRGLAESNHRLSHAIGEWKADIGQRLTEAHITLGWTFDCDRDMKLSVVQWSGLTRILRELVTNAIYHAQASRVDIDAIVESGRLTLTVADDGNGRDPDAWSHGLGLGGVRKRVKLLGGRVQWRENGSRGIVCEVVIEGIGSRDTGRERASE